MKPLDKSFTHFLTNNNSWILLIAIAMICFMWVMTFISDLNSFVYLTPSKWWLWGQFVLSLIVLFAPLLLFSFFRRFILEHTSTSGYYLWWILAILVYPIGMLISGLAEMMIPVSIVPEVVLMFIIFIGSIEILTNPYKAININLDLSRWREKASPEWVAIGFFLFMSVYGTRQLIDLNEASGGFVLVWIQNALLLSVYYLFYRINHYYLLDHIYRKRGLFYYSFAFLGLMMIFFIILLPFYLYLPAFESFLSYKDSTAWIGPNAPIAFWSILLGTVVAFMWWTIPLAIVIQWLRQSSRINRLQKENSETELNLLKQQISPHFFFNTLNNVYSMSLTKDEKTSEGILQLSDLMRYVIYRGKEKMVPLKEEIKYLEDYIQLQQLRINQDFDLHFTKNIDNDDFQVAPLLLIILVENAFKHGIEMAERSSYLHINLVQKNNRVVFSCINSIENDRESNNTGVGLANLKRRLGMLYPDRYELILLKKKNSYEASLTIEGDIADL